MKLVTVAIGLALILAVVVPGRAQEPELINEIVARINNDIITRADYMAAVRDLKEELTRQLRQQGKTDADIEAEFERLKPTVLDLMIDNLLLEQKAKELGIDVEADVNYQMAEIAKQNGIKNVIEFEEALKKQGVDPETARGSIRKELQHQYVMQREVLQPIYQGLSDKDKREFYEKHKDALTSQGEVVLSEIFLTLEGHTAAEVEQRAKRIVAELRAGGDFADAVQRNSAPNRASRAQNGKIGSFKASELKELKEDIAAAISNLKPGEVTEPIRLQDGFQIIKLDERKEAVVRPYSDPEVQQSVARGATMDRAEEARKKFLARLREEAFIKITSGYATAQLKTDKAEKKN
jgi:peptidyl-prolyl cis-trans isomerase SurA